MVFGNCLAAADEPPYGLEERIPWNSSRLVGSPEPPLPYTVERTYTKHEWKSPIYIPKKPEAIGSGSCSRITSPIKGSSIVRIKDDPAPNESEIVLEIPEQLIYSVCFDPDFDTNGHVYVFSNGPETWLNE